MIAIEDLPADIAAHPSIALMLAGANGQAARVAPCLVSTDPAPSAAALSEAKLLLLGAITRWAQQGASGVQQQVAGPFSVGTFPNQVTGYRLRPSEVTQLQEICSGDGPTIGSIDTAPGGRLTREHLAGCDFWYQNGNGSSCSCGLW